MEETGRRPETDDAIRMALAEVDRIASAMSSPEVASLAQRLRTAAATIRYGWDRVQCMQVRGIGGDDVAPLAWHPSAPESLKDLVAQAVGVPANAVHLLLGSEDVTPETLAKLSSRHTGGVPSKPVVLTLVVDPECKEADDPLSVETSGKLFFEKARRELSTHEYSQFLGIIQCLQQSQISREDALEGARRIFGPGKSELHDVFESLILLHRM
jgi:hypothetical protein